MKNMLRVTCEQGHTTKVEAARDWLFGSAADFCSKPGCPEAPIVKREYWAESRWLPLPED